jgi:hypothetical protein
MAGIGKHVGVRNTGTDSSSSGSGSSCVLRETPGESTFLCACRHRTVHCSASRVCRIAHQPAGGGIFPPAGQLAGWSAVLLVLRQVSRACGLRHMCPARCAYRERLVMLLVYVCLGVLVFTAGVATQATRHASSCADTRKECGSIGCQLGMECACMDVGPLQ